MSVRKRAWTTPSGEPREVWIVTYTDQGGTRRQKTFSRKREADAFRASATVEIASGVHVPDSTSLTVAEAGKLWLETAKGSGLEASTQAQYRQHLNLHIKPLIGGLKLSTLNVPTVRSFADRLRAEGRSPAMTRKVLVSLGSLIGDAQERGLTARNPVRDLRKARKGRDHRQETRQKGKLRVGVDIPSPPEVRAFLGALEGRFRPVLMTAVFTGLRASELRGLVWRDIDLDGLEVHVTQRADAYREIGAPKSLSSSRMAPLPPSLASTLREWKLKCPKGELRLAFPNAAGGVVSHKAIRQAMMDAMIRAGVAVDTGERDKDGRPVLAAKYTGLHALRHFHCSWLINPVSAGGLGLPLKVVSERMGHSSVVLTANVYGHLFPRGNDGGVMEAGERALLG